ncbi:hypothetical protein BGZ79_001636, partial [Entomortierella chlamydospora]
MAYGSSISNGSVTPASTNIPIVIITLNGIVRICGLWPRLHSFSIGLEGSPDLAAARVAAELLKTVHY